jgi:transposase
MSRSSAEATGLLGLDVPNLMADGYSAYSSVVVNGKRSACWSHGRRDFYLLGITPKGKEGDPDDPSKPPPDRIELAATILYLIQDMYVHECRSVLAGCTGHELVACRRTHCRPLVDEILRISHDVKAYWDPKLAFAKACAYLTNREGELKRFLDDANVPLDNNVSERALRIVALGRNRRAQRERQESGHSVDRRSHLRAAWNRRA